MNGRKEPPIRAAIVEVASDPYVSGVLSGLPLEDELRTAPFVVIVVGLERQVIGHGAWTLADAVGILFAHYQPGGRLHYLLRVSDLASAQIAVDEYLEARRQRQAT